MATPTAPDSLLTVSLISRALEASPDASSWGGEDFWLKPDSLSAVIVRMATKAGYIVRLSHTQAQWTDEGLAKARAELPA